MEMIVGNDARAIKGWIIIQLVVGVMNAFFGWQVGRPDREQDWTLLYKSIAVMGSVATLVSLSAIACLLTSGLVLQFFWLVLTWGMQIGLFVLGNYAGMNWFRSGGVMWSTVSFDLPEIYVFLIAVCMPSILILTLIRFFRKWRVVGRNDYWRRPGISIAGLLGLTTIMAIVFALIKMAALYETTTEMRGQLTGGLFMGILAAVPLPWLLRKVLQPESSSSLPVGFALIGAFILAMSLSVELDVTGWPRSLRVIGCILFLGYLPVTLLVLYALRYFGWRLVRGVRLTPEERIEMGLKGDWERIDSLPLATDKTMATA